MGKRVLTLRDVEGDLLIDQLLAGKKPTDTSLPAPAVLQKARQNMIHRALIRKYLSSTGLLAGEPEDRFKRLSDAVRAPFPSQDQMNAFLAQRGLSPSAFNDLLMDRALEEMFLKEQLPLRVKVSENDVKAYYEREKSRRFLDKPFGSVEKIVRESAVREKLDQEFQKWLDDETHRTEILLLPLPGEDPTSGR